MKIIFMGSPAFALPALEKLIEEKFDIVAVYTQAPKIAGRGLKLSPTPVQMLAEKHNLPIFTPHSLKSSEEQDKLRARQADIGIVAAYGLILPKAVLDILPCINIHPSLLPRWRGAAPIQRTIMAGDYETGVAIMQMSTGLDTGDILLEEKISITDETSFQDLHDRLAALGAELLVKYLRNYQNIAPKAQSQDGVTYASKISKEEYKIDFNKNALQIIRLINALPGTYFIYNQENIKIHQAKYEIKEHNYEPGEIIDQGQFAIACHDGIIYPQILQRPGKKALPLKEFISGFNLLGNKV